MRLKKDEAVAVDTSKKNGSGCRLWTASNVDKICGVAPAKAGAKPALELQATAVSRKIKSKERE